jgi:hypothetical protein
MRERRRRHGQDDGRSENLSPNVRIKAGAELLNRGFGKPVEFREEHRAQVAGKESALETALYGKRIADMTEEESTSKPLPRGFQGPCGTSVIRSHPAWIA